MIQAREGGRGTKKVEAEPLLKLRPELGSRSCPIPVPI